MTPFTVFMTCTAGLLAIYHLLKLYQWRLDRASFLARIELLEQLDKSRVKQVEAAEKVIDAMKLLLQPAADMLGLYAAEGEPIDVLKAGQVALAAERVMNGSTADMLAVENMAPVASF